MSIISTARCLVKQSICLLNCSASLVDLYIRYVIAAFFFSSALTKLSNWDQTIFLFTYEYSVPLLPPDLAALAGTAAELVLPVLLLLGFATRYSAIALFIFNVVAVFSYSFLWTPEGNNGLMQHYYYGMLILVPIVHGPGWIAADTLIHKYFGESSS